MSTYSLRDERNVRIVQGSGSDTERKVISILKVLSELPSGKIRRQRDALLVKGLTYLVRQVPDGHPGKSQIVASVLDAWKRSEKN